MTMNRAARRRHERSGKQGVYVGFVHPDDWDANFGLSLLNLVIHDARGPKHIISSDASGGIINVNSSPRIAPSRNIVVSRFLDQPADWLLMIDADMVFAPSLVDQFLAVADKDEAPIVGGLCFAGGKGATMHPTMYRMFKDDNDQLTIARFETVPENQMVAVNGTGAACLFVHRSVLEKMQEHYADTGAAWFAETYALDKDFGEDVTFCIRAQRLGFPIFVHTGITVGHRKRHILDLAGYERQQAEIAEIGYEAYIKRDLESRRLTEMEVTHNG